MNARPRYLRPFIEADLKRKMVFLAGPRQVGKTTLAITFLDSPARKSPGYLNWELPTARKLLLAGEIPPGQKVLVLDEIHKYRGWRNLVKGLWDKYSEDLTILVTGSARLDYYRRGGDSLQGRYHFYRLHPLTLGELGASASKSDVESLLRFGGFPEPFFAQSDREWRRWQSERIRRVVREDLRDLEDVREISSLDLLVDLLPARVGSILSIQALRNDLGVSHEAVARWVTILENLYHCFRIPPYGVSRVKAVKKEQKLYLWDWSSVAEPGPRFENLVASHLLKYCHFIEDTEGHEMELRFLRNVEKREIDFVVLKDGKPEFAVECKAGEREISPHIAYFAARTPIPRFYQVHLGQEDRETRLAGKPVRVIPFTKWARELELP